MGSASPRVTRRLFCATALTTLAPVLARADVPTVPLALPEATDLAFVEPLLKTLGEAGRFRWQSQSVPFSRVLHMAEQGQAVGFGISPTEQRKARLQFSMPVFQGAVWAISRRDHRIEAQGIGDLKGRVVCMSRSAVYGSEFEDPAWTDSHVQYVTGDLGRRLRTFAAGHCDVLLVTTRNADIASLRTRLKEAGEGGRDLVIEDRPLLQQGVHFAAAKDTPLAAWLPRIDRAIRARRARIARLAAAAG